MEERIQRKVEELHMNHPLFKPSLNPPTYQSLYQEAVRTLEEELFNEDLKKRIKQKKEEQERIDKSWKEERERQERVKKEKEKEEEYEQFKLMQQKAEQEEQEIIYKSWKEAREKQLRENKEEEEEREKQRLLQEKVERETRILTDREKPDSLLVINDLHAIDCISEEHEADKCWDQHSESELLHIALKELNIEIIKRIVRNKYPHKFA
jgi:hypothetical protein